MLEFIKNIDFKTWIIVALILVAGTFITLWALGGDSHKSERDNLKEANEQLEKDKKALSGKFDKIMKKVERDSLALEESILRLSILNLEIEKRDKEIEKANRDLDNQREKYLESKRKIKELKDSTVRKEGEELINSVKEKTKES